MMADIEPNKMTSQEWIDKLREHRATLTEDYRLLVDHIKSLDNISDLLDNEDMVESVLTAECILLRSKMEKLLESI